MTYDFTGSLLWNAESSGPSASSAADTLSAEERLPTASVIAPTAIGPSVWPMPKAIVIAAMLAGHSAGGKLGRTDAVVDSPTAKKPQPKTSAEVANLNGKGPKVRSP